MWGITMDVPKHFARKYVGGMAEILSMDPRNGAGGEPSNRKGSG
jgi:hypothetical protein